MFDKIIIHYSLFQTSPNISLTQDNNNRKWHLLTCTEIESNVKGRTNSLSTIIMLVPGSVGKYKDVASHLNNQEAMSKI